MSLVERELENGGFHVPARTLTMILYGASVLSLTQLPSPMSAQSGQVNADTSKSLIEIRFARRAPAPELRQMTDPQTNRAVYVSSKNVFTDADFADVRTRGMPDALVLSARWEPGAVKRWTEIRRGEVSAGNDLLAVFVDGELVSAPFIVVDPSAAATPTVDIAVP